MRTLLEQFIQRFVRKEMRERVAHEWKKKSVKLHYRVCHKGRELFSENFRGGQAVFASDEKVLFLCGSNAWELPFSEAKAILVAAMAY